MASLLHSRVEKIVILNDITQDNNKVLEEESNETAKFHRLENIMEESVSKFQIVVKVKQNNGGTQQKCPLVEKKPSISSNQEQRIDQAIKRRKVVESRPIAVCVEARLEACRGNNPRKGVKHTGKKVYRTQLPSNYK